MTLFSSASLAERLAALDTPYELVREAEALEALAEDYRHLCHARGGLNLTDAAKVLEVKPRRLIGWLLGHGWIFREPKDQLAGMQSRLESGHLKQKIIRLYRVDGSETFGVQVFITAKGMATLAAEFRAERAQDERRELTP
jgi:phage antirepressor YoqD-like protein